MGTVTAGAEVVAALDTVFPSGAAVMATVAITSMSTSQSSRPVDLNNAFSSILTPHPKTTHES